MHDFELELTPPRTEKTFLCCFSYDEDNNCIEEFDVLDGNQESEKLDGFFIDESPAGCLESKFIPLETWLRSRCEEYMQGYYADDADYNGYVEQHRLTKNTVGSSVRMKPTLEEYRTGNTHWLGRHNGVHYKIVHWGITDYRPKGIWNYYIYIYDDSPDFNKFYCEDEIKKFSEKGNYHITNDYYSIPDEGFHGGIKFYENKTGLNYKTGKPNRYIKIGCYYNHLWDREGGYWQGKDVVENDCKRLIDVYLEKGYKIAESKR